MKRIFMGGMLMLLTLTAIGQESAVDKVFNKYSGKEGYTTVYISSFMFNLLSSLDTDDPEYNEFKKATAENADDEIIVEDDDDTKKVKDGKK